MKSSSSESGAEAPKVLHAGTALLVIDLQRQFGDPASPFAVEGSEGLFERICAFVDVVRSNGVHIVWVRQEQRAELPTAASARRFANGETLNRGQMAAFHSSVVPAVGDTVLVKPRQSAFYATDLEVTLRLLDVSNILIAGVTTNVCCFATGVDAIARGFDVTMLSDLTEALPIEGSGTVPAMTKDAVRDAALAFFAYSVGTVSDSQGVLADIAGGIK